MHVLPKLFLMGLEEILEESILWPWLLFWNFKEKEGSEDDI